MAEPTIITNFEEKIIVGSNGICSSAPDKKHELPEGVAKVLITKDCIMKRIEAIAEDMVNNYKEVFAVIVLKGAKVFFNDLKASLEKNSIIVIYDEIKLTSYCGTESTCEVKVDMDIERDIEGKDVIVIEDIVDTGLTLTFLIDYLLIDKKAKSVKVCTLLDKPSRRKAKVKIDHIGFEVPNEFIVGYGLDYEEKFRELPYIASVKN